MKTSLSLKFLSLSRAEEGADGPPNLLSRRIADLEQRLATAFGRGRTAKSPYSGLLEQLPEALIVHSENHIHYVNPAAAALFGGAAEADPDQRKAVALADGKSGPIIRQFVRTALGAAPDGPPPRHIVAGSWGESVEIESRVVDIDWNGEPAKLIAAINVISAPPADSPGVEGDGNSGVEDGIWDWDLAVAKVYMSRRLRAMLGYGEHDLAADQDSWVRLVHPRDRADNEGRLRDHLQGLTPLFESRVRMRRKTGDFIRVRLRGKAARDGKGRARRVAGTMQIEQFVAPPLRPSVADVTQIDDGTRNLLLAAMDAAGIGLAVFDPDDRLVLINGVYREDVPELPNPHPPDANFEDILRYLLSADIILDAESDPETWLRERVENHRAGNFTHNFGLRDGRTVRVTEFSTADGGTVVLRSDMTRAADAERDLQSRVRELEKFQRTQEEQSIKLRAVAIELAEARDEANAANHTKSEFLANMSHELRTPLNAIMGFSEVIKDEMFGPLGLPQYVDYAKDIYESGAHPLEIINDILDLSKVEAGKLDLAEDSIALDDVVVSVLQIVKSRAEAGGIKLLANIPEDLPYLYADERKLKQVLLNLLSNAIKFTHQDGAVDLIARISATNQFEIIVRDTGIGIAPDKHDLVLSPFGQVDSALAREHQGTGLGLPLVKALIELHDGDIDIDSEPGRGTTVTVTFPASRTLPPDDEAVDTTEPS